ncbi:MAG: 4Fe-4S dicluster domain-containing protein, partial [Bacteroidetes bacterium]|nr:4Fe-4S dicluster domain-containing protein [Bacteroidota bacterium]
MSLVRRDFLKTLGLIGASLTVGKSLGATTKKKNKTEFYGVLIDTTRCVGCRACEWSCAEANGLPEPTEDEGVKIRKTSVSRWTAVSEYGTEDNPIYVKKQCMQCMQPACASACLTKAMNKTDEGPIVWREDKCMGCRSCMISCPFDVPKFEYDSPNPKIQKCQMCFERLEEGGVPACVENCGGDALLFGKRKDLLEVARSRIYNNPDDYYHHVYGEHEVGGTGVLYLSSVPF